jgi:hypothetical protein
MIIKIEINGDLVDAIEIDKTSTPTQETDKINIPKLETNKLDGIIYYETKVYGSEVVYHYYKIVTNIDRNNCYETIHYSMIETSFAIEPCILHKDFVSKMKTKPEKELYIAILKILIKNKIDLREFLAQK